MLGEREILCKKKNKKTKKHEWLQIFLSVVTYAVKMTIEISEIGQLRFENSISVHYTFTIRLESTFFVPIGC